MEIVCLNWFALVYTALTISSSHKSSTTLGSSRNPYSTLSFLFVSPDHLRLRHISLHHRHSASTAPTTTVPRMRLVLIFALFYQISSFSAFVIYGNKNRSSFAFCQSVQQSPARRWHYQDIPCLFFLLAASFLSAATGVTIDWFSSFRPALKGSECMLENRGTGVCKSILNCPPVLKEIQERKRHWGSSGRCGFENFTEIVCCPQNVAAKIQRRPADIACDQHNPNTTNEGVAFISVFNGLPARVAQFPFAVALGYKNTDTDTSEPIRYICGGSLISLEHVLTAAHCVKNIDGLVPFEVRLGDRDLNGTSAVSFQISRIIAHPQYKFSQNYHDVAIIKLTAKVNVTSNIRPACLETKSLRNVDLEETLPIAIGWGLTSYESERGSNRLLRTPNLWFENKEECAEQYQYSPKLPNGLDDSLLCARDRNTVNRSDTCQGDSGGPLLYQNKVLGITAFGSGCGSSVPGVYTAVYPYLDWIEEQVWPSLEAV